MARAFDDASSQYLEVAAALVSAEPFSFATWFYSDDATIDQTLIGVYDTASANEWHRLTAAGNVAGDPVRANTNDGGTNRNASTSTGWSANTWHHAAAAFIASNSRAAWLDGGGKGTNGGTSTITSLDTIAFGRNSDSTPDAYLSGSLAESAIWATDLSDDDALILAKGLSPLFVKPASLVLYAPLFGRVSPEQDLIDSQTITVNGATTADHPRIIYPSFFIPGRTPTAVPSTKEGEGAFLGIGTLAASGNSILAAQAALQAIASLGVDGAAIRVAQAALQAIATFAASGELVAAAEAALQAIATLSANAQAFRGAETALRAIATLDGAGSIVGTQLGSAAILAQAILAAEGNTVRSADLALLAMALLEATGTRVAAPSPLWTPISAAVVTGEEFPYTFPIEWGASGSVGGWESPTALTGGWVMRTEESELIEPQLFANQGTGSTSTYLVSFSTSAIEVTPSVGVGIPGWDLGGGYYAGVWNGLLQVTTSAIAAAIPPPESGITLNGGLIQYTPPTSLTGLWTAESTEV